MIDIPDDILPTNEKGEVICPQCKLIPASCSCPVILKPADKKQRCFPRLRIEKSGRKGKIVTLIENLPGDEIYLHNLTKNLKIKTGTGGTFYLNDSKGIIELQGNQLKFLEEFFKNNHLHY